MDLLDPATIWSHPLVNVVLGDSLHPGGTALTLEMAREAGLAAGARILDVGCGPGASAAALAAAGYDVTGIDVSATNIDRAKENAPGCRFQVFDPTDIAALGTFDAVLSECALCLTGDHATALRQWHGLLHPGGKLLLSDMTVEAPAEAFRSAAGFAACLGGALPSPELLQAVKAAGFEVLWHRTCPDEVAASRAKIYDRIDVAAVLRDMPGTEGLANLVSTAEAAWAAGHLGYLALVARHC